jgi:nicotinate-nucleotide pyrophosphorylase (carboxylating)
MHAGRMTDMEATALLIRLALQEDVGTGDYTSLWTVPESARARADVIAKAEGVLAGVDVACDVFREVDPGIDVIASSHDGAALCCGDTVLQVVGSARSILTAERVVLNFLQRLSGVATITRRYVDAIAGTGTKILDTRKTTPGMRALEKSAVRAGGGANHRFGLHDMVLIKENHIAAAGGISAAIAAVRAQNREGLLVEVETTTAAEVEEALAAGVDRILFDNMPLPLLRQAVQRVRNASGAPPETEASGGITLATIREVAETGVTYISVGALTHSAPALDLSLRLSPL